MANYQSTHTGAQIDEGIDLLGSNSATQGQVLTANGTGGASWQDVDNKFRYTHFIEVEFNPAPEPYVSYVLIGTITYVCEISTALTSIDDLPLDVALPIHGMYAEDNTHLYETYTATRKTRSDGTSYLEITYLYYDNSNGLTKGTPGEIVPTTFTDTVL